MSLKGMILKGMILKGFEPLGGTPSSLCVSSYDAIPRPRHICHPSPPPHLRLLGSQGRVAEAACHPPLIGCSPML